MTKRVGGGAGRPRAVPRLNSILAGGTKLQALRVAWIEFGSHPFFDLLSVDGVPGSSYSGRFLPRVPAEAGVLPHPVALGLGFRNGFQE
ncbi:MAG: hypothetical protein DWQ01_21455 [Planctomycetota bacterium]|nr:MAG: hypothetical protein DWQ01_21455 [Planctomycetota bacterium]